MEAFLRQTWMSLSTEHLIHPRAPTGPAPSCPHWDPRNALYGALLTPLKLQGHKGVGFDLLGIPESRKKLWDSSESDLPHLGRHFWAERNSVRLSKRQMCLDVGMSCPGAMRKQIITGNHGSQLTASALILKAFPTPQSPGTLCWKSSREMLVTATPSLE